MTDHAIRIPVHRDAAFRIAAILAEPVANARRITLDLTLKTDPDGRLAVHETITAIPRRLTIEREDRLGEDWLVATYSVTLEAADELTDAITTAALDAPPTARTDPISGALRALELELLLADGTATLTLERPIAPTVGGPIDADPVPASDQD